MIKSILIGFCGIVLAIIVFIFPGEAMSIEELNQYTIDKAYLAKNGENYARCYNSVNHGVSSLSNTELSLQGEYFNDPRISSEKITAIEQLFMADIKKKCEKTITEYEAKYKEAKSVQEKSTSLKVGWRTFLFGGGQQNIPESEMLSYTPSRVSMTLPFDDYIFSSDEVRLYFMERLEL